MVDDKGWEEGKNREMTAKWIQDFFVAGHKNALELDSSDGYTTL